jgi:hypothetical protein
MGNKSFTVTYKYGNGIPDAMIIEGAKTETQAEIAANIYTTGLGIIRDIHTRETVLNDAEYTHRPALKAIGE